MIFDFKESLKMKLKKIALGAAALALVACGEAQKPVAKVAAVTPSPRMTKNSPTCSVHSSVSRTF
jgi:hypothetical protein